VPGPWTIRLESGDNKVAEKTFKVVAVGDIYVHVGKWASQLPRLRQGNALYPNEAMTHNYLGHAYREFMEYDLALEEYTKAISLEPHPNFYNNRCLTYNNKGEYDKALEDCNQALALDPRHIGGLINRGNSFRLQGKYDKAIEDYNQSLQIVSKEDHTNSALAYYNRALAYEAKGELDKAQADRKKACELDASLCKNP